MDISIRSRLGGLLIAALLAAGCAGNSAGAAPAFPTTPAQHGNPQATLRIRVPKHRRRRRRADYVSPATQSAQISISPASGCGACSHTLKLDMSLMPGSPNCAESTAGTTCSISLTLAPGSYTGSIATYDGPLVGGAPSGNELSANDAFPVNVAASEANAIGVTLDGIPNGVAFGAISLPTGSLLVDRPQSGWQLSFMPAGRIGRIAVYAADADGYTIAGAGAPSLAVSAPGVLGFDYAVAPGSNVMTVTAAAHVTRDSAVGIDQLFVTLSGPGCAQPGAYCSGSLTIQIAETIAIMDQTHGLIEVCTEDGTQLALVNATAAPSSAAFDSKGNLFVADSSTGKVNEYAWPYYNPPIATFGSGVVTSFNGSIAIDPLNDSVALLSADQLQLYSPPYTSAPATYPLGIAPLAAVFDYGGNLFVTASDGYLRKFSPPLFGPHTYVDVADTNLSYLYLDDSGLGPASDQIYAGGRTSGKVYQFDATLAQQGSPATMPATIDGIAEIDADLYISESAGNVISNYGEYNYTVGLSNPSSLAIDDNGNLVVLQSGTGVISFYAYAKDFLISQFSQNLFRPNGMTVWP
jgi:hypothetical protein